MNIPQLARNRIINGPSTIRVLKSLKKKNSFQVRSKIKWKIILTDRSENQTNKKEKKKESCG